MSNEESPLPEDEYLNAEQLRQLHTLLKQQAAELMEGSREDLHELAQQENNYADELDLATNESNRDFALRLADRERRLLQKIRRALERIQDGDYGTCDMCGGPIAFARLMARPVATQCIDCKTASEQLERPKRSF